MNLTLKSACIRIWMTSRKKDLLKYINDETEIYKPDGIVELKGCGDTQVIPDIVPEPVTEKDRIDMYIWMTCRNQGSGDCGCCSL